MKVNDLNKKQRYYLLYVAWFVIGYFGLALLGDFGFATLTCAVILGVYGTFYLVVKAADWAERGDR